MLQFINQTDSIKTETLNCLLYGEPGIGKTSLAFTSEKPLLIDFDSGLQRACYRLDSVRVETWEDVNELQNSKKLTEFAPKTLIIDTVGAMLDNYIAEYVKKTDPKNARRGGELSLQGYGAMKNVFNQFLNWGKTKKINLIFVAHVSDEKSGDETKYIPKVTGGSYDILRQTMDLIGYMSSNLNKRTIDFRPIDSHIGKDCAQIGMIDIIDYRKTEYRSSFSSIIEKTLKSMNDLAENQTAVVKIIQDYTIKIQEYEDLKVLNDEIKEISKTENQGLKIQMFNILRDAAKDKGIEYDKETKLFKEVKPEKDV